MSKEKGKKTYKYVISLTFLFFAIAALIAGVLYIAFSPGKITNFVASQDTEQEAEPEEVPLPDAVDFQPVVDEWAVGVSGNKGVYIYDLDRDEVAGVINPNETFSTASIYKLFVVYEGYRRVQSGEWNADEKAGYTGYTIRECLDLAIRQSYSPCAETLWDKIGRQNLDTIIENDFGITNSDISGLDSNPEDVAKMMKIFYEHKDVTDEGLLSQMKDSFLNQPKTEYDWWRQGLPSGFTKANVYNKVGWEYNPDGQYWNIYHDAAIVEFPEENRHFIVVAMTNYVPYQKLTELGTMIEKKFYQTQQ